jgi:predicted CXXCH cytochrome family protein
LANLVQKVVFLALAAATLIGPGLAAAAPFSHKVHLEKKIACAVCHSRASASAKAEDNLLPNPAVCSGCHQDARQVKSPRSLTVSKFNHQLHLKLGNTIAPAIAKAVDSGAYLGKKGSVHRPDLNTTNACAACHRGLERSDEVSLAVFPHMADCLVCHQPVDPPFSCGKCHTEGQSLKPASHTNEWLESHSRKTVAKDKESCAVCHGREFRCLGCH